MTRAPYRMPAAVLCAGLLASCTTHGGNAYVVLTKVVYAEGTLDKTTGLVTDCVLSTGADEALFPEFDATTTLSLGLVLENRLAGAIDKNHLSATDFVAEKVVVSYEATGTGTVSVPERTLIAQGYVPTGSKGVILADLIQAADFAALATQAAIRVHVYVVGKLTDGSTAKSSDYEFIAKPGTTVTCVGK